MRGYDVHIVLTRLAGDETKVDVSAEAGSKNSLGDTGGSKKRVREYLAALDNTMRKISR